MKPMLTMGSALGQPEVYNRFLRLAQANTREGGIIMLVNPVGQTEYFQVVQGQAVLKKNYKKLLQSMR